MNLPIGTHVTVDGEHANPDLLNNVEALTAHMENALALAGATWLGTLNHEFTPQGVTILMMLAESHISLHTYPEHCVYFADVFTCGTECDPKVAAYHLVQSLGGTAHVTTTKRGNLP